MKKILALLLTVFLLFTMVASVWGAGYRDTALAWVMEKYGVPAESVEIFEGGTLQLEKIGESFWFAKYVVYRDGKVAPSLLCRLRHVPQKLKAGNPNRHPG